MEICGNICVTKDCETYTVKCLHCGWDINLSKWQDFVIHVRNMHTYIIWADKEKFQNSNNNNTIITQGSANTFMDFVESEIEEEIGDELLTCSAFNYVADQVVEAEVLPETEDDDICIIPSDNQSPILLSDTDFDNASFVDSVTTESSDAVSADLEKQLLPTSKFKPTFFRRSQRTDTFMELYKAAPCLWNIHHIDYENKTAKKEALLQFMSALSTKVNVTLKQTQLEKAIQVLCEQYAIITGRLETGEKLNSVVRDYHRKCNFLAESIKDEAFSKKCNENDELRIPLILSTYDKLTEDFIAILEKFPLLYQLEHEKFTDVNARKEAYEAIAKDLLEITSLNDLSDHDVFVAIKYLRGWYFKISQRIKKSGKTQTLIKEIEQYYFDKCKFLPKDMFKLSLPCSICHKIFFSDFVLRTHLYKIHNVGELPYKCTTCALSFDTGNELLVHKQRRHIGKVLNCTHCERTFAVPNDLRLHLRIHTGNKPYVCESCGKAFRIRTQLNYHITAIHTKIRAFKCEICTKDFLKRRDLQDHIKSHYNIRDKICETCGKGFTNSHSLIRHRQIHAEIKKFACKLCGARFAQFVGLNSHMKRKHSIVKEASNKE